MSSSNCFFLTCIQVSHEAGQVVWYSPLLKNFPQFIVIYTVKGFGIVNKAETDVFLEVRQLWRMVQKRSQEELPHVQGQEQWLHFAGAAVKRYPTSKVKETQVRR